MGVTQGQGPCWYTSGSHHPWSFRMRRSLFAVLALASLIPTIALADNNDDCVEGDKDVDGPAPRSAWGVRSQARHASLLLRPHPLTAERVSSWRRARPDPDTRRACLEQEQRVKGKNSSRRKKAACS